MINVYFYEDQILMMMIIFRYDVINKLSLVKRIYWNTNVKYNVFHTFLKC